MKKNIKHLFLLGIVLAVALTSCKKKPKDADTTPPEEPAVATGSFMFHLHTYIEDTEVDAYNIVYTSTSANRKISLSMLKMYVSNIQLVKADGTTYDFSNKKILKVFETETYLVGTAPVGNYKSIRFKIGLDAATNQLNPSTPSDSTLLNKPLMWFGAAAQPDGYVFLNLQGKIDTSSDASGTIAQMQPFVYKIGTNANYKQINMPDKAFTIVKDQAQYGHVLVDYLKLFNGIQLNQSANLSVTSATANAIAPGTTIANNIPLMFSYEQ